MKTFADPVAAEGEIMITVKAAGFHRIVKALASGTHYGSTGELPMIPGVDGVGLLPDGKRVYFGGARSPYGTFEELCAVPGKACASRFLMGSMMLWSRAWPIPACRRGRLCSSAPSS